MAWTRKIRNDDDVLRMLNLKENEVGRLVIKRRTMYLGHLLRNGGIERTILEGKIDVKISRGRPLATWSSSMRIGDWLIIQSVYQTVHG